MTHRSVLITGASSGIGAALAKQLATRGTEVVLAARSEDALRELAGTIEAAGGKAAIEVLDVADAERTEARVRELDEQLAFDLVIANAGIVSSRWGGELSWADCRPIIAVNLCGAIATLTGALPGMVARRHGRIVGISSIGKYRGVPRKAAYCGSKAFLSIFLESLRVDLHGTGVGVTDVRPGYVDTPMTEDVESKPFSIDVERAARTIARGIERRRSVVIFPPTMAAVARLLEYMPDFLWGPVVRRGHP